MTSTSPGSPPPFPANTLPLYSTGGINMPGLQAGQPVSPNQMLLHQQTLQRAFIQSAVAQNMQIQQHLMAQNQALQQLLTQTIPVSFQEPEQSELWSTEKAASGGGGAGMEEGGGSDGGRGGMMRDQRFMGGAPMSPPPPLVMPNALMTSPPVFSQAAALSSPVEEQTQKKQSNASDDVKMLHDFSLAQSSHGPDPTHLMAPTESPWGGVVPPPPPMPTHLQPEEMGAGFMDPYQRAKTVRIGKWRWPPPKGEEDPNDSFLQFKIRQQSKKMSRQDSKDGLQRNSRDESFTIEWEEFEVAGTGTSSAEQSPRKESQHQSSQQHVNNQHQLVHHKEQHSVLHSQQHQTTHHSQQKTVQQSQQQSNGHAASSPRDKTDGREKGARRRRDSWGNPVEENKNQGGIGKLKISREMREKLEALTSSHPSRAQKGPVAAAVAQQQQQQKRERSGIKKLEAHRRYLLQHQLEGDKWDTVDSVQQLVTPKTEKVGSVPPPPPVAPPNMYRSTSPAPSISSQDSTPVIPQPRSPPPPIQPSAFRPAPVPTLTLDYRDNASDRRTSVSTLHTEKTEHFELEESSEFLEPVDRAPILVDREMEQRSYEGIKTHLLPPSTAPHLTYSRTPWSLTIRKEVFSPGEVLHGKALQLVFCQVVTDVFAALTPRITAEQRAQMRKMLDSRGITPNNTFSQHHKSSIKREIIEVAKSWPLYFAAIFPITGSRKGASDAELLAVSHSGVRLLRMDHSHFTILSTFTRVEEAECGRSGSLRLLVGGAGPGTTRIILHTPRSRQVAAMIAKFLSVEVRGSQEYVRAVADYLTSESRQGGHSLLSFRKGDIIRVTGPDRYGENGWLQGVLDDRTGLFPVEYVAPVTRTHTTTPPPAAATTKVAHPARQAVKQSRKESSKSSIIERDVEAASPVSGSGGGSGGDGLWTHHEVHHQQHHHHHHHQTTTTTTTTVTSAINNTSAVTTPPLIHHHSHHDDSGHSSEGEGGGGEGSGSGGGRISGIVDVGGGGSGESVEGSAPVVHDGKHSLLQFALQHFRVSKEQGMVQSDGTLQTNKTSKKKKSKENGAGWTWKEQVEMVKFTQSPLSASLLPLDTESSQVGVESFLAVMRYMGDYPMAPHQTEVHCVYTILMNCHKQAMMRDEVYCQVMKQTTNNKSSIPDSCQRGWRLFSILAAYFTCSDTLKPYLFKYLETAAYDKRRAYHGTAMVCLQNLRKTFKYGGRKNVPSIEEITAITAGRSSKRQIYRLPGGTERVINTKSTSVVQDIIEEMCNLISVRSKQEQEEYSLYCIVEGDTFTMPLAREEYILDVTTELLKNQQVFYLIFCRSVWYYPLRSDNPLYYEVVFNQIAPDYLEGLLLVTPGEQLQQEVIYDIAKIAALLHRAADLEEVPTMKEVKYLLPKPALTVRDVKPPQWVNMVQSAWPEVASMTSLQAKAQVLEILQTWPLFGSSFFAVKRVMEPKERTDYILALNKNGVHFLDLLTHETLTRYSLAEVMSTRKVKSEDELFLDMKCGNLMQQRITRIQTDQAHEISRLIRQYITIEQRVSGHGKGDNPRDMTLSR